MLRKTSIFDEILEVELYIVGFNLFVFINDTTRSYYKRDFSVIFTSWIDESEALSDSE